MRQTGRKPTGRHPQHRLTTVSLTAKKHRGRYADGHGLYLVVDPSGAKRWMWRGVVHGKRCELGLGSVALVTLADARRAALDCRRTARSGGNPRIVRQQSRRAIPTFEAAAIVVHAEHSKTFKNPKHKAQWLQSLRNDVFPLIGARPINTIETSDVLKVLTPVWTTKPETARRLKQRMELVFEWAKASGFRDGDSPTAGIVQVLPKHKGDKQHFAALPFADVPAFLAALGTIPDMRAAARLGLEFLILTATRTTEVRLATWAEVNLDQQVWTIPGTRMKAGKAHRVPLSPRAVEILTAARTLSDGTSWIFPGTKPDQPLSTMTLLKAARRLTTATVTNHGFRSSFDDWTSEKTTTPRIVVDAALAHVVKDKTDAAYRRTDLFDRRRALMDRWAQYATATPADVVALPT